MKKALRVFAFACAVFGSAFAAQAACTPTTPVAVQGTVANSQVELLQEICNVTASYADTISQSFTRPADTTPYSPGDLVANSTTAGSVVPLTFAISRVNDSSFHILRARLSTTSTSLTNALFRLHLYRTTPTIAAGDNAAWSTSDSNYLGSIDVTLDRAFTDRAKGFGAPAIGSAITGVPDTGTKNVYGLLTYVGSGYTPLSAQAFTVTLEAILN